MDSFKLVHGYNFVNHDFEMEQERDDYYRKLDQRVHDLVANTYPTVLLDGKVCGRADIT